MKQSGSEALDGGCGLRLQPATMRERKAAATPGRHSISIPLGRTRQLDVDGLFRLIHFVIFAESLPPRRNHLNQEPPARNLRNVADSGEVRLQIHLNLLSLPNMRAWTNLTYTLALSTGFLSSALVTTIVK